MSLYLDDGGLRSPSAPLVSLFCFLSVTNDGWKATARDCCVLANEWTLLAPPGMWPDDGDIKETSC